MSVINNVLKDLETRESQFTPIEITSVATRTVSRRDLRPLLFVALLLLLVAATGFVYLQERMPRDSLALAPVSESDAASLTVPVPAEQPVKTPGAEVAIVPEQATANQIVGLQLRESEQEMSMEFVLRDKAMAYLKERGENSFGYHLRQVESQIAAPLIKDNRWIRNLAITSSGTGVDIYFETASDILVETRQDRVDGEPVWAINLRKVETQTVAQAVVEVAAVEAIDEAASAVAATIVEAPSTEAPAVEIAANSTSPESVSPSARQDFAVAAQDSVVKLEIKSIDPDAKSINQLEYAVELINSRRMAESEALLTGLLEGSEDHSARQHLLALYSHQNRRDRFARLVRESMIRYPQDELFRTEHARSLFKNAAYRTVIELFRDDAELDATQQALVAASHQRLDEHDDAVRHYRLALALEAGNSKNWIGLGISQENTSALADALNSYQQAVKLGNLNNRLQAFVTKRIDTLRQVLN